MHARTHTHWCQFVSPVSEGQTSTCTMLDRHWHTHTHTHTHTWLQWCAKLTVCCILTRTADALTKIERIFWVQNCTGGGRAGFVQRPGTLSHGHHARGHPVPLVRVFKGTIGSEFIGAAPASWPSSLPRMNSPGCTSQGMEKEICMKPAH